MNDTTIFKKLSLNAPRNCVQKKAKKPGCLSVSLYLPLAISPQLTSVQFLRQVQSSLEVCAPFTAGGRPRTADGFEVILLDRLAPASHGFAQTVAAIHGTAHNRCHGNGSIKSSSVGEAR